MKKASTEDLRIFLMEVTDEIGSAHPETRDTKISARLLRDILTELLANREAQPVAEVLSSRSGNDTSTIDKALPAGTKLYTAPPAPAVPGKITPSQAQALCPSKYYVMNGDELNVAADFWNACRAAMLAQPVSQGYKLVPVDPTEEMIAAAMNCDDVEFNSDETFCVNFDNIYRAMLAAAPEGGNG